MNRRKFDHVSIEIGYNSLNRETTSAGRKYISPNGKSYPSVTTVLSILTEDAIREWRQRVGEEEANRISTRAAGRGTSVHLITEKYLKNIENYSEGFMPHVIENFKSIQNILDTRIGKIYAQEFPLYSDHLELAGTVDCIAEFDGKLSIIDFKTSKKLKEKNYITNYFIQESAYSIMWEERTGQPITQLVTIIAVDDEPAQVFKEHRDNWTDKLIETINEYKRRKLFGH